MNGYAPNSTLRTGSGFKGPRKRINPVSPKKAAERKVIASSKRVTMDRSKGRCEIKAPGCTGAAIDPSHVYARRFKKHGADVIKPACRHCHEYCHQNSEWARDQGHFRRGNGLPIQKFEAIFGPSSPKPSKPRKMSPSFAFPGEQRVAG
jgi:hypothetical protein